MLLIVCTRCVVALNNSLNRHTERHTTDIYVYIYEKSSIRLASVGLAQARPNHYSPKVFVSFALNNTG